MKTLGLFAFLGQSRCQRRQPRLRRLGLSAGSRITTGQVSRGGTSRQSPKRAGFSLHADGPLVSLGILSLATTCGKDTPTHRKELTMNAKHHGSELHILGQEACGGCCSSPQPRPAGGLSRRSFLQGLGAAGVAMGGLASAGTNARAAAAEPVPAEQPFPRGTAAARQADPGLRPARTRATAPRGGATARSTRRRPPGRRPRGSRRNWPSCSRRPSSRIEVQPVERARLASQARAGGRRRRRSVHGLRGRRSVTQWPLKVADGHVRAAPVRAVLPGLRDRPLAVPAAERRSARRWQDFDADDVVVDSSDELLWRLRAMYGLKNARGTKMLAIGGLAPTAARPRSTARAWPRRSGATSSSTSPTRSSPSGSARPEPISRSSSGSKSRRPRC